MITTTDLSDKVDNTTDLSDKVDNTTDLSDKVDNTTDLSDKVDNPTIEVPRISTTIDTHCATMGCMVSSAGNLTHTAGHTPQSLKHGVFTTLW